MTKIFSNTTDAAERRRWIALVVVCLAQLMSVLDVAVAAGCVAFGLIAAFAFLRTPRERRVAAREVEVV